MTKDDIKRYQFAKPFKPFKLRLSDGREHVVDHPEFLIHSRTSNSVMFITQEDRWELIDLRHLLSVSSDGPPADERERDKLGLDDNE